MIDLDFLSQLGEGNSVLGMVLPINVVNLYFLHVIRIIFPLYLLCYRYYKLVLRSHIQDRGCNANEFFRIPVNSSEYPNYLSQ